MGNMHWGNTAEQGSYAKHAVRDCGAGVRASTCDKCAAMFMLHGAHGVVAKAARGARIIHESNFPGTTQGMNKRRRKHHRARSQATKQESHALRIKVTKWFALVIQNCSTTKERDNNRLTSS